MTQRFIGSSSCVFNTPGCDIANAVKPRHFSFNRHMVETIILIIRLTQAIVLWIYRVSGFGRVLNHSTEQVENHREKR